MSVEYKLTKVNEGLRLEISGNDTATYEEYVAVVSEAKERIKDTPEAELQTFVNVRHETELEFFVSQGFFIVNTMLMMEKDLEEPVDQMSSKIPAEFKEYDFKAEGLKRYLKANKAGFDGIQDPEEQIIDQISQPHGTIHIAEKKGDILASVTTWDMGDGVFATENVFTVPKAREQGLAAALLTRVLELLKNKGAKRARLSVYGDDLPALLLYIKLGYHILDSNYELRY